MSRLGKCTNYSGCLLAYRGEETSVDDAQPFVCAECGKPLAEVKPPAGRWLVYGGIGLAALVVIGGLAVAVPKILAKKKPAAAPAAPEFHTTRPEATEAPVAEVNPDKKGDAEPPAAVVAEKQVNMAIDPKVKAEVLKRIDLMPTLTSAEKDKLYNSVERARKMGLVITVPFGKAKSTISPGDALALKDALDQPEIAALRADPLAALVILGYADPKGDPKANLVTSRTRAEVVAAAIRKEIGDKNLVRSVAMGGSTLLDAQNLEKNRIAEVWVVLP
jgi:outer membrane protein OmpA-like peptidoglycan-associated protein